MQTKEYNGWTNYETWNVKLWIDNNEGSYQHWTNRAFEMIADETAGQVEEAKDLICEAKKHKMADDLADEIKDWLEENNPIAGDASCYADLLGAAISEVNFGEIAWSLIYDQM